MSKLHAAQHGCRTICTLESAMNTCPTRPSSHSKSATDDGFCMATGRQARQRRAISARVSTNTIMHPFHHVIPYADLIHLDRSTISRGEQPQFSRNTCQILNISLVPQQLEATINQSCRTKAVRNYNATIT